MLKLKLSPKANDDLEEIFEYSFNNWGINQAEKYQDDLYNAMLLISNNPNIGVDYYFKEGCRKFHINKHFIFYKLENKSCVIIRILHEKMDVYSHLTNS